MAIKSCFILVLLYGVRMPISAQEINYHWFNQGVEQQNRGEYDLAIQSFSQFIANYPEAYPEVYYHRGYLYFQQKKYQAAIPDFERLHALDEHHVPAVYALGQAHFLSFRFQEAIDYFTKAIRIQPNYAEAYNERGMVLCRMRRFDLALEDFYRATNLDSTFAMAYNNTGVARYFNQDIAKPTQKDLRLAHQWFSKAIVQDPTLGLAYRNRAAMNIFLKSYAAASLDLKRAEKLSPEDAMVFFYLGVVHADQQQTPQALTAFERATQINPQLPFAYEELGNLYKTQRQFDSAIQQYRLAQKVRKQSGTLYRGLMDYRMALVYAERGASQSMYAALKAAKKAKIFADRRVYQDFLVAKEFKTFRSKKAFRRFTKSIRKGKKDNKFLHPDLGWFRMRKE
ncbi:MAG: tetratricopeptide repeat protein [Bacteroidota bacterium]